MKGTVFTTPLTLRTAGKYCALLAAMVMLNFALPMREPLSSALLYAALACGFDPLLAAASHLLASTAALSWMAMLSALLQAVLLSGGFWLFKRLKRKITWEKYVLLVLAQLPFAFLFPHAGYALPLSPAWQKALLSLLTAALALLFEGGLDALMTRAFRCRLTAAQLLEVSLLWLFWGAGMCSALGEPAFYAVSLTALLLSVQLLKNAAAVPLSVVLSLPLCLAHADLLPMATFSACACVALLLTPYGRIASALSLLLCFPAAMALEGLYAESTARIVFTLAACLIAVILTIALPEKLYRRAKRTLLFYRERTLPRIAINRSRRAVGERLYEVSSLFREIETAFSEEDGKRDTAAALSEELRYTICADCEGRQRCEKEGLFASMDRLVSVGAVKGQVSLVDLPADLGAKCRNAAGLLFACNRLLAQYQGTVREEESARESRRILAEQAHGVSEILRDIALEQSEECVFSEGENALAGALAQAGILSSEVFVYGEGGSVTVSLTLPQTVSAKRLCSVASAALGVPLSLAEKIVLSPTSACFVLRRKPEFDAAFGVATKPKEGETRSGDTYSVLKIDERRFLVALSDGMGSGAEARDVSDRTLTLLESFYKAKMPSETVLSTVNRLISYSGEERFSCLDLAAVDLDTGDADIVKIGSPVGFILAQEELRVLEGESLPLGMLEAVHPATLRATLHAGDFMLFMSDGVTGAFGSSAELYAYLSALRPINPQSLAEEVLKKALSCYRGKAEDDMTVLAVKLMKTA